MDNVIDAFSDEAEEIVSYTEQEYPDLQWKAGQREKLVEQVAKDLRSNYFAIEDFVRAEIENGK